MCCTTIRSDFRRILFLKTKLQGSGSIVIIFPCSGSDEPSLTGVFAEDQWESAVAEQLLVVPKICSPGL